MAVTRTTLKTVATARDLTFSVTASTGATVGGIMQINGEFMRIVAIPVANFITVRSRGDRGGVAQAHDILSPVAFGLDSDFADLGSKQDVPPPSLIDVITVGQNGVVPAPKRNTVYVLNKAAALASTTFADPLLGQDGLEVTFVTATDYAHVITTVACHDGTTGAHTTNTSAAYIGACLTLLAVGAKWMVKSNNNWTIT